MTALLLAGCGSASSGARPALDDTWLFDGVDWSAAHSATAPSPRFNPALGYDSATRQLVLFGGTTTTGSDYLNDTWTWDGGTWSRQHPARSPGARALAGLVYDPTLRALFLIGGVGPDPQAGGSVWFLGLDDVWKWDGQDWNLIGHMSGGLRFGGGDHAAYDPPTHEIVAVTDFGTLSWDGSTWRDVANPSGWEGAPDMYVDPATGRLAGLAAFANADMSLTYRIVTWDEAGWRLGPVILLPDTLPGWLHVAGRAFDPKRRQLVFFGGDCNRDRGSDTLAFDGKTWIKLQPQHRPPGREYTYMAFDSDRSEVLMFGGYTTFGASC